MTTVALLPRVEGNWLLSSLPPDSRSQLLEVAEVIATPVSTLISQSGQRIEHVYFPVSGCLSVVAVSNGAMQAEVGTVGWEGLSGLSFLHGVDVVSTACIVQVGGAAVRVAGSDFSRQLRDNEALLATVHRYAQYWTEQSAVSIACNGIHNIEQRCARWLLHTHDRVGAQALPLTQEFLGIMLAVRRASVSVAAEALQKRGLISYSRGKILIVDRAGLERAACSCYAAIQACYARLLPRPRQHDSRRTLYERAHTS